MARIVYLRHFLYCFDFQHRQLDVVELPIQPRAHWNNSLVWRRRVVLGSGTVELSQQVVAAS